MSSKFSFGKIKDLPKDTGLIHKKAVLLEKMGKLDEAIESYKISAQEGNIKSQYTLGKIYLNKKQYHGQRDGILWLLKMAMKRLPLTWVICIMIWKDMSTPFIGMKK